MSIEEVNVIDAVGIREASDGVTLVISDHLDWGIDDNEHMYKLQEKINTYLRFVESGEIYENLPDIQGRNITIEIVGNTKPNRNAKAFLDTIRPIVESAGLQLNFRLLDS